MGPKLFGMTTYAIAETACHSWSSQCDGTGYGFKCDTFGVCESQKMSELQLAIMALAKLPDELQRWLIDASLPWLRLQTLAQRSRLSLRSFPWLTLRMKAFKWKCGVCNPFCASGARGFSRQ